jgi:hypothetical protein
MKKNIKKNIFPKNMIVPIIEIQLGSMLRLLMNGKLYPPKNNDEMMADEINMFIYSANK